MLYLLIAILIIVVYLVSFFNRLKTIQVRIKASIQEIGNQLKRQANLIPNLIASAKSYLTHEKEIYALLTSARTSVQKAASSNDAGQIEKSQKLVDQALSSLKIVVESNPQLQSAPVITGLMDELRDTADKLMYSRRTLIDLSADFNTIITTIPGIWLAPTLGFKAEKGLVAPKEGEHLEVSTAETKTPKVEL